MVHPIAWSQSLQNVHTYRELQPWQFQPSLLQIWLHRTLETRNICSIYELLQKAVALQRYTCKHRAAWPINEVHTQWMKRIASKQILTKVSRHVEKIQKQRERIQETERTRTEVLKRQDRKSTRLNSSHVRTSRMPSSAWKKKKKKKKKRKKERKKERKKKKEKEKKKKKDRR